ncbi:MAG TPA: organic hydroperoxide resistance protein [Actinophytocola sp.]|uniref:organic hydroperoxide resistance protein n=1 Tax=Actinophytocola sp. TaxID=1872138 RepID=UPI002DDDB34A|nr:organic hydroperoxide resistance protein [Actinophytocola sp.]HEV2782580.1 organic hydroperoxide resistance protein [Actinophytocola sp.]
MEPLYTAEAHVAGGRDGRAWTADGRLDLELRQPKELGGDGAGTNPEQLFAIGYAACFATVLTLLGRREKITTEDVEIDSKAMLIPTGTGAFKLGVELDIALPSLADAARAMDVVREAHRICPYSNATRGNIDVSLIVNGARLGASALLEARG